MAYWSRKDTKPGFTLPETMAALGILAIVCSGVVVVVSRCSDTVISSLAQVRAAELANEQMQQILAKPSVTEGVEYGRSEQYKDLEWQTRIEAFEEPVLGSTWVRAICSVSYTDANGQPQTLELTSWLTRLTEQQLALLSQQPDQQLIEGIEAAAEYAQVDVQTIRQWIENGMVLTEGGAFIKANLDLYRQTSGSPTDQQKQQQLQWSVKSGHGEG